MSVRFPFDGASWKLGSSAPVQTAAAPTAAAAPDLQHDSPSLRRGLRAPTATTSFVNFAALSPALDLGRNEDLLPADGVPLPAGENLSYDDKHEPIYGGKTAQWKAKDGQTISFRCPPGFDTIKERKNPKDGERYVVVRIIMLYTRSVGTELMVDRVGFSQHLIRSWGACQRDGGEPPSSYARGADGIASCAWNWNSGLTYNS